MKRNFAMTIAACLLVVTMLSLCMVSSTYAKYTTADDAYDTARVAKWGVSVAVTGDDAFGEKYNDVIDASGTKVISSVSGENVLAPGTNGDLGSVKITGKPEVRVSVAVDLEIELTGWIINVGGTDVFYCPLVISDGTLAGTVKGTDYTSAADFIAAIEALVDSAAAEVAANTVLDGTYDVTLTWSWAYYVDDATDVKDTALGNLATASTIAATWNASVTQVD